MIEPLAAMRAACLAIADGEAAEIELTWERPDTEDRLIIIVRREPWRPTLTGKDPQA